MLETHTLKKHLDSVRQELSQALYQHDAGCRVIARVVKERDAARDQLAAAQAGLARGAVAAAEGEPMEAEEAGITSAVIGKLEAKNKQLSAGRRKRKMPEELPTAEKLKAYTESGSHTVHQSSKPGVLSVDVHQQHQNLMVTGGVDKEVKIFDRSSGKVEATLAGHGKKVVSVKFHPTEQVAFSCSADKSAKVWGSDGEKWTARHTLSCHTDEVTDCSLHATNEFLVTSSKDSTWAFHDIAAGKTLAVVKDANPSAGVNCVQFHPDGLILGTGTTDNLIRVWDIKTQQNVASFEGHTGAVNALSFSENGYHLASGGDDGFVRLWDLRKVGDKKLNFRNLEGGGGAVNDVSWDSSGTYLASAGVDLRVYIVKQWDMVAQWTEHTAAVTGCKWGAAAGFLASSSMDRSLKIFA